VSEIDTSTPAVLALAGLANGVWMRLRDGERFVMHVPAQPDHDMDLILSRSAATMCALLRERDTLRERLRLAEEVVEAAGLLKATFGAIPGHGPEDDDICVHDREESRGLTKALAAWRAAQQGSEG
jgi:hypothetical protein